MCSIEILSSDSCILDNFPKIFSLLVIAVSSGIIFGALVGTLKRSIDN